jgi:flagellar biosynthesis/type III secretory pathway M-ring protein FliF/YscJ
MEKKVKKEVNALTDELKDTVAKERERGGSLSDIKTESESLGEEVSLFAGASHDVKRRMWWKSMKWILLISVPTAIIIAIIVYRIIIK